MRPTLLLQFHGHDVVVHEESVADVVIFLPHLVHAHVLVKAHCRVLAVHVQLKGTWAVTVLADKVGRLLEEETPYAFSLVTWQHLRLSTWSKTTAPYAFSLVTWQHVYFLQVPQGRCLLLDRHIALARCAVIGKKIGVMLAGYLSV